MVDCHIHIALSGGDWRAAVRRHKAGPDKAWIREILRRYQAAGVTYLRDGGDKWGVGAAARALAPAYGICFRAPGTPLYFSGHYGGFLGEPFRDLEEFREKAACRKAEGADFLKLMASGIMDFSRFGVLTQESPQPKAIAQAVEAARQAGLAVMVHANGPEAVLAAAEAGADSVEHGAYLTEEALAAMARAGTVWVPTLSPVAAQNSPVTQGILAHTEKNLRRFAELGGRIAPGSDGGASGVFHGAGTEYALLTKVFGSDAPTVLAAGIAAIQEKF